MKRKVSSSLTRVLVALLLAVPLGMAFAQDDDENNNNDNNNQSPPMPMAPAEPAFGPFRQIDDPLQPNMREAADVAWVRVINLSPSADTYDFTLTSNNADVPAPMHQTHSGIAIGDLGSYESYPAGSYDIQLLGTSEDNVETLDLNAGRFYTLVLMGLELPPEVEAENQDNGGFFGWISGLFGGEDGGETYRSRTLLLEDNLFQGDMGSVATLRVVNAAPGLGSTSVAVQGESGRLTGAAAYGEATGYNRIDTNDLTGPLEVRIDDSRVVTIPLDEQNLMPGTVNTVFIYGTPLEDAPVRAVTLSTPAFSDQ